MRTLIVGLACLAACSLSCATMPTAPGEPITVTGRILDRDGNPVSKAYLNFLSHSRPSAPNAVTDANGHYEVSLNAGHFDLFIQAQGFSFVRIPNLEVSKDRHTIDHQYTGYWVRGRLTGPNGTSLVGAHGYASSTSATGELLVNANSYSVLLPQGTYEFRFSPGYGVMGLPEIRVVGVPIVRDTTIDVALDGNVVAGTVTGPGNVVLPGAIVSAMSDLAAVSAGTDLDGHYELRVPSGVYSIRATPPQPLASIANRQLAISIQQPTTLDFDLSGTHWSGFVRLASDSTPVAGAELYAYEAGSSASTNSDPSGKFQFVVRTGGFYRIDAFAGDESYRATVTAIAGSDSTFDLYLSPTTIGFQVPPVSRTALTTRTPERSRAGW